MVSDVVAVVVVVYAVGVDIRFMIRLIPFLRRVMCRTVAVWRRCRNLLLLFMVRCLFRILRLFVGLR